MKEVCIVIPVYKDKLSGAEEASFRRTLSVLSEYDTLIVCPEGLDTTAYTSIAGEKSLYFKTFAPSYFSGTEGYNRLLLSKEFYQPFSDYRYILICQLDAYVFRDELLEWCSKGYDFIGAPLVGHYTDTAFSPAMRVGNGGFSLRKVETALHFFASRRNVFNAGQICRRIDIWKKPWTRIFVWGLMMLGWHNKPQIVADRWRHNEDDFWSGLLSDSNYALRLPSPSEAMRFSFERFPKELYEMTGHALPFGCHAWEKYQFEEFWKGKIK